MWLGIGVVLLVLILCIVAFNHAKGMSHFTERPDDYDPKVTVFKAVKKALCGFNVYRTRITDTPKKYNHSYSVHKVCPQHGVELTGWYITTSGSKGLVVLYNWFGGCKSDNLEASEVFLQEGYEVFLLDLRGHGDSSGSETFFGYHEYRDVLSGIEYAKHKFSPKKLIVYGVSLGAVATMRAFYAAEVRGVDGLILEAPFDKFITTIRHRVGIFKLPEFFFANLLAIIGGVLQGYNPFIFNPVSYAKDIDIPVLLICGRNDPYVMCSEIESIYNNLKNKEGSEVVLVTGHGHGSVVLTNKALFAERVRSFLKLIN